MRSAQRESESLSLSRTGTPWPGTSYECPVQESQLSRLSHCTLCSFDLACRHGSGSLPRRSSSMAEARSPARQSMSAKPDQIKEEGPSSKIHIDVAAVGVGLRFLELAAASQVHPAGQRVVWQLQALQSPPALSCCFTAIPF